MNERPISSVPKPVLVLLAAALALQIIWGLRATLPQAKEQALHTPPNQEMIAAISFGENIAASQLMALFLQAFDNQPGISIPFQHLDYSTVIQWLDRMLELDSHAQYPLLMATHLYTQVPDPARQKQMLDFTYQHFFSAPNQRWQWLAHAAITAKHRLHDLPLALKYSQAIARYANSPDVPHWAQQMPIFILEEMGETESAKILLGSLLANNTLNDPHEIQFLTGRLNEMESGSVEKSPPLSRSQQD